MNMPQPKIAFVSPHCLVDFTNGAATATLDALVFLQSLGFHCEAFCNSRLGSRQEVLVEEVLAQRGLPYKVGNAQIGQYRGRMIFTQYGTLPVTLFNSVSTRGNWANQEEIAAFLTAGDIFLRKNRPDLVWTYGGDEVAIAVQRLAKRLDIPILFALHNFSYHNLDPFRLVDRVIVPTEYARRHYREKLGLECEVLPLVVDPGRVKVASMVPVPQRTRLAPRDAVFRVDFGAGDGGNRARRNGVDTSGRHAVPARYFVTFVNPEPRKGVHVFARIAEVLSRRRPDIRLLLVEGAAKRQFLPALRVDLSNLTNVTIWPNTPDPRAIYAVSKMILMPSLMENAGFIAMEAMTNGIPVLASNRGGLPETIGDAASVIDIPARYTPETRDVPTAEEAAPWVETIIRLWDDAAYYEQCSRAARERARVWHPDRLAPLYRDFFSRLVRRTSAALVPRQAARQ